MSYSDPYGLTVEENNPEEPRCDPDAEAERGRLCPVIVKAKAKEAPSCGRAAAQLGLSAIGDALTLSGPYAAFRVWQGTSIVGLKAAGNLSANMTVNAATRMTAGAAFRSEAGKMTLGVVQQSLSTYISGDSWDYAVPVWGTLRRIVDTGRACF